MSIFSKPEVVILKESSDSKLYLEKLEDLAQKVPKGSKQAKDVDKEIMMVKAGIAGEEAILFELKNSGMDLVVLHDILIVAPSGNTAQIDFYVITPYLNIVIECKNLYGNIEINDKGEFVRTISYGGKFYKEGIYSPITQNERHLQVLKECKLADSGMIARASINLHFNEFHKSLVVLANSKTVVNDKKAGKELRSTVIRADQLIAKIKEMNADATGNSKSSLKEMREIGEKMLQRNREDRKDYSLKYDIKDDVEVKPSNDMRMESDHKNGPEERLCPRCGAKLILRTAAKGEHTGEKFWGCESYPKCRYHEYIDQ